MPFQPNYEIPDERRPYTLVPEENPHSVGVLMLHGFMGSPLSSRPLAEYLSERGIMVHCPLLPGHGSYPNRLQNVSRSEWLAEAEDAYRALRPRVERLFVMGHSMGNVLGAHIVTTFRDALGMVMIAPVYHVPDRRLKITPIVRHFMPWYYPHTSKRESMRRLVRERVLDFDPTVDFDSPEFQARLPMVSRVPLSGLAEMVETMRHGRKLWPRLSIPTRIYAGEEDHAAPPENARLIYENLPGIDKQMTVFPQAGHELMRPSDPTHEALWPKIADFFLNYTSKSVAGSTR